MPGCWASEQPKNQRFKVLTVQCFVLLQQLVVLFCQKSKVYSVTKLSLSTEKNLAHICSPPDILQTPSGSLSRKNENKRGWLGLRSALYSSEQGSQNASIIKLDQISKHVLWLCSRSLPISSCEIQTVLVLTFLSISLIFASLIESHGTASVLKGPTMMPIPRTAVSMKPVSQQLLLIVLLPTLACRGTGQKENVIHTRLTRLLRKKTNRSVAQTKRLQSLQHTTETRM